MFNPDDLAARLPARRDDEPETLRQDILDEIGDHLACAVRRELMMAGGNDGEAIQRAIQRFGDPVKVATRLWRDALWEKIMSQRLLIAMCAATVLVSAAALGMTWTWIGRQTTQFEKWQTEREARLIEQLDQQKASLAAIVEQQSKATAELAKQLESNTTAIDAVQATSDWNPVEFQFRSGGKEGPPVPGVKVRLTITGSETGIPRQESVSKESGNVRFERVRYGTYWLHIEAPTGELFDDHLLLQPGEGYTQVIPCPLAKDTPSLVKLRVRWPEELAEQSLSLWVQKQKIVRPVEGFSWSSESRSPSQARFDDGIDRGMLVLSDGLFQAAPTLRAQPARSFAGSAGKWSSDKVTGLIVAESRSARSFGLGRSRGSDETDDPQFTPLDWPGNDYRAVDVQVLRETTALYPGASGPRSEPRWFGAIHVATLDWGYEMEPGDPATLWLTPTPEAVVAVKDGLSELDELEQHLAERQQEFREQRFLQRDGGRRDSNAAPEGGYVPKPPNQQ